MIAETSILGWVIGIFLLLAFVSWLLNSVTKSAQTARGRRRCAFCGARLKSASGKMGFADHCAKCGRAQPWIKS